MEISGKKVQNGTIKVYTDGKIEFALSDEEYCAKKEKDSEDVVIQSFDESECSINVTVKQVAAGSFHTVFLMNDGTVKAVGRNSYGQLGDGTTTQRTTPVSVIGINGTVKQISAGYGYTVFLMEDGTVKTVGSNSYGQLGDGTKTQRTTPVSVIGLNGTVKQISAGSYHTVFLMEDETVKAVGRNSDGQSGDGTTTQRSTPVSVTGLNGTVKQILAGSYHTVFLMNDGTAKAVGRNSYGLS